MYLVDGLKYNLVVFSPTCCLVVNMNIGDVVLREKRHKNFYKVCISFLPQNNLTCLSALNDDVMLWHKKLGHASLSLLNKLISKRPSSQTTFH